MLKLRRKEGEVLVFINQTTGEKFEVDFYDIRGGQCRVAIDAPPNIRVLRKELFERYSESDLIRDDSNAHEGTTNNSESNPITDGITPSDRESGTTIK